MRWNQGEPKIVDGHGEKTARRRNGWPLQNHRLRRDRVFLWLPLPVI
jgi:hypothetical protein